MEEESLPSSSEGGGGSLLAALKLKENALLAELAILEYYLHMSIVLRLDSLRTPDLAMLKEGEAEGAGEEEKLANLKKAHYYCEIIQSKKCLNLLNVLEILQELYSAFGMGQLPLDESLSQRLKWAKFIGLVFFYNRSGDCWSGEQSNEEALDGILAGYSLFTSLFPTDNCHESKMDSTVLQQIVEITTQVWIYQYMDGLGPLITREPLEEVIMRMWPNFSKDDKVELEWILMERLKILEECIVVENSLIEKFPFESFKGELCEFLWKNYKDRLDPPIIVSFCEGNTDVKSRQVASEGRTINHDDKLLSMEFSALLDRSGELGDFTTQPPDVLLPSSSPEKSDRLGHFCKEVVTVRMEDFSSPKNNQPIQSEPIQSLYLGGGSNSGLSTGSRSKSRSASTSTSTSESTPAATSNYSTPSNSQVGGYPSKLIELVKEFPQVPPQAFRGALFSNDKELVSICEGSHQLVRKFLDLPSLTTTPTHHFKGEKSKPKLQNDSKDLVKATTIATGTTAGTISKKRSLNQRPNSSSLLDRHESAERIEWSSQRKSPSNSSLASLRFPINEKVTPPHMTSLALARKRQQQQHSKVTSSPSSSSSKAKRKWSDKEVQNIIKGYKRFGSNWSLIQQNYEFDNRTNVNLKDKARNLRIKGLLLPG